MVDTTELPKHADNSKAVQFLDSVDYERAARYEEYFQTIKPRSATEIFRRALFAFASVHTTWRLNCKLYQQLWDLRWRNDKQLLLFLVSESGAGLHNNRMKFIWDFAQRYWAHPEWYLKQPYEDWFGYRDRLDKNIKGLGLAKAAFFSELVYFEQSRTTCMDVHMIKLFGLPAADYRKAGASVKFVQWCEREWDTLCAAHSVAPVTARWLYWDMKQKKPDSRYWSQVLEEPGMPMQKQLLLFPEREMVETVRVPA